VGLRLICLSGVDKECLSPTVQFVDFLRHLVNPEIPPFCFILHTTMESVYESLADRAIFKLKSMNRSQSHEHSRLVIAIAGGPGSGKTTSATRIASIINDRLATKTNAMPAMVISMDGFHYPRKVLDTFPNREEAYVRRGSPWTFDAEAVVALVRQCHRTDSVIMAPSFDHALKDPIADSIRILPEIQIILLEGNYLLLDKKPWSEVADLVHDRWFFSVDLDIARQRIAARHVRSGIEPTFERALWRVDANDLLNARYISENSTKIDVKVESIEEGVAEPAPAPIAARVAVLA
jgi:pantothenate kinase